MSKAQLLIEQLISEEDVVGDVKVINNLLANLGVQREIKYSPGPIFASTKSLSSGVDIAVVTHPNYGVIRIDTRKVIARLKRVTPITNDKNIMHVASVFDRVHWAIT
jgi:hypothetical protein